MEYKNEDEIIDDALKNAFINLQKVAKGGEPIVLVPENRVERRKIRILCEKMGLEHTMLFSKDTQRSNFDESRPCGILIRKYVDTMTIPSFDQLLKVETGQYRLIDYNPPHWNSIYKNFLELPDSAKTIIIQKLLYNMKSVCPNPEWGLMFVDALMKSNIQLPRGTLSSLVDMCYYLPDKYGMIEVLYLASEEDDRHMSQYRRNKIRKLAFGEVPIEPLYSFLFTGQICVILCFNVCVLLFSMCTLYRVN